MTRSFVILLLSFLLSSRFDALALSSVSDPKRSSSSSSSRRRFFQQQLPGAVSAFALGPAVLARTLVADAAETPATGTEAPATKLGLTDEQLKDVVKSDLLEKQFLVTGNLTPTIYAPTATFTDEIDTYGMDQWRTGTQKLFVGEKSDVRLVGDVDVSRDMVEFRFDEDLMFNIPFRPTVHLTGKVILSRDAKSGYVTSYQEFWDQDVASVLKTATFK